MPQGRPGALAGQVTQCSRLLLDLGGSGVGVSPCENSTRCALFCVCLES